MKALCWVGVVNGMGFGRVAPVVLDGSARSDHSFPFIQWNILHLLFVGLLD